jgi:polar amino acid transport system substrate-binding protein
MHKLQFKVLIIVMVAFAANFAHAVEPDTFPHFRHVDRAIEARSANVTSALTLLADEDFAPFSFKTADGKITGLSVQMALAVCGELKIACQIKAMPFSQLLPALAQKQGDVIVGGPVLRGSDQNNYQQTRPYFYAMSIFLGRAGGSIVKTDAKSLAGRRIGFVKATTQETFLQKNYDRSVLVDFVNEAALFEALRTGSLDVGFADVLHVGFWLKGSNARNCCVALGESYFDRAGFSHPLSLIVAGDRGDLRDSFDFALDQLQSKGASSKIFATFLTSIPF